MGVNRARELCPSVVVLPYDFPKIDEVSKSVYECFLAVTLQVQAVSCDEAFLDLSEVARTQDPSAVLSKLRADIYQSCGVTVSAGLAPNMLLARLATAKAKPDGLYVVTPDAAMHQALLDPLAPGALPGVGHRCAEELRERGVQTIGQLRTVPLGQLQAWVGPAMGSMLHRYARGVDDRRIVILRPRKYVHGVGCDVST
jgi:nucleotidyltransferase/DNA polymerase involved in DNA repair